MAESTPATMTDTAVQHPPVVVKKYANRRLYNTETSSYITLENLADMIRAGRDFVVYDAKSGDDITRGVLTQIIVEEESKGSSLLPTNFLRQLIGFYGDSLQGVVPRYLEQAMSNFARQQQQMRQVVHQTFGPFLPMGVEEMGRQNIALMERAMTMFNPFHRPGDAQARTGDPVSATASDPAAGPASSSSEMDALRHEVESLRAQLAIARAEAVMIHAPIAPPALHHEPTPEPAAEPIPLKLAAVAPKADVEAKPAPKTMPASLSAARKGQTSRKSS